MSNAAPRAWRMFLPLAIVLLLALLWTIYWFVASGMARDRLEEERAKLATRGLTLACVQEGWSGYPFHFEFSCSSPVVQYAGKAEFRSANLLLVALAYAPWQVVALVDGPTAMLMPTLAPIEVTHQRAVAAATFDSSWQPEFSLELPGVSARGIGKAGKLMLFTRNSTSGGTDIALEGEGVTYRPEDKPMVRIDTGSLQGTLKMDRTFSIDKFELRQGQLRYWGSGQLALDEQNRISGQIDTETNDITALLSVAGPQLGLSDSKMANLRTMLGLLGNDAKAPIIARDGILYLGPFQITELKPLY